MAKQANVIGHWHQLFLNFQASSMEFYASIERGVNALSVAEIHGVRVEHKEGGLASANRQYLRMHRGKHAFDICAAPFGNGFFVSWWFTTPPLKFAFLYTLAFLFGVAFAMNMAFGIGMAIGTVMKGEVFGIFLGGCTAFLGVPALLWLIGSGMQQGTIPGERTVLAMPLVGWLYEIVFAPDTFYAIDTGLMFQDAIHRVVLDVIDVMTEQKGVRSLTEAERKPILKQFAASA